LWFCARAKSIGNIARKLPQKVEKAIPKLLGNTKNESTVVRWCAAYALTEIAMNSTTQKELLRRIDEIVKKEKNNSVRVYLKALKAIGAR